MRQRAIVQYLKASLLPALLSVAHLTSAQPLVIENGILIDGNGGPAVNGAVVIVEGDKITAVSRRGQIQYPQGANIIDASGKFVLPGFIDTHVHYYHWFGELYLNHGITTVYDLGNNLPEWTMAQKIGTEKGKIFGPRIYMVGYSLAGEDSERATGARNPEDVRRLIQKSASLGAEGVKVHSGMPADLLEVVVQEAQKRGFPVAIHIGDDADVMTARRAVEIGVNLLVHGGGIAISMIRDENARKRFLQEQLPISEGGGDPWYLIKPSDMDEFVQLLISKNVYWNPTATSVWRSVNPLQPGFAREIQDLFSDPRLSYIPPTSQYEPSRFDIPYLAIWQNDGTWAAAPRNELFTAEERQRQEKNFKQCQLLLKKFFDAGGKILPGSDPVGSGVPGIGLHHEFQMLVDAGIPPIQVISFATKWSAEYIRHGRELGTIEAGKVADMVILRQNPLTDIRNTRSIDMVIKGGEIVPLGYHATYHNPLPRPFEILTNRSAVQSLRFQLSPRYATEGDRDLELSLRSGSGRRFWKSATVYFNDVPLETRWVDPRELRATVPARLIERVGVYKVRINYPGATGGFSPPASLIVGFK